MNVASNSPLGFTSGGGAQHSQPASAQMYQGAASRPAAPVPPGSPAARGAAGILPNPKPARKASKASMLASWCRRHMRTLALNYHIMIVFLLLTGAIVTAGILVVKEVADKDESIQRLADRLTATSVGTDTMGVQMAAAATLASVASGVMKDPTLERFSNDFDSTVALLVNTLMQGLAGRRASMGSGDPMNETLYLNIYKNVVSLPLVESIFMAPNGVVSNIWRHPAAIRNNETSPRIYPAAVLYESPIWRQAMNQAALRRVFTSGDVHVTTNGYHMLTSFFPVYVPNSLESTTFIPGVPDYPFCDAIKVCYSNTTKEKLWGWVGIVFSNDRIFASAAYSADILAKGNKLSSTMVPRPLMLAASPNLTKTAYPFINSPNITAGPYTVSALMNKGLLWQYYIIMKPVHIPHVAWRAYLYAAVALIGLGMGLMYISMAITRAGFRNLLRSILPPHVVDPIVEGKRVLDAYDNVTVLVLQLCSFHDLPENASVVDIVQILDEVFSMFDRLLERYGGRLTKLYQLGDFFMVCANCPTQPDPADEAAVLLSYALDAQTVAREFTTSSGVSVTIRIALNSGHCVGACLGYLKPSFTLLSPTVNDALQLQSAVPPGSVVITQTTAALLYSTGRRVPFQLVYTGLPLPSMAITDAYTVYRDLQSVEERPMTQPGGFSALAEFGVIINPMGNEDNGRVESDQLSMQNLPPVKTVATREDILYGPRLSRAIPQYQSVEEYTQSSWTRN